MHALVAVRVLEVVASGDAYGVGRPDPDSEFGGEGLDDAPGEVCCELELPLTLDAALDVVELGIIVGREEEPLDPPSLRVDTERDEVVAVLD